MPFDNRPSGKHVLSLQAYVVLEPTQEVFKAHGSLTIEDTV